jgi:hypothetical protein
MTKDTTPILTNAPVNDPKRGSHKDTTGLPKIGRLIHVRGYDKCRAAIVTGEGEHWPEPGVREEIRYIEIFAPNLKPQESVLHSSGWHYVDECTD